MPAPGKTKFIKFPPYRAAKDVKCPGGCLSFDLTGTLPPLKIIAACLKREAEQWHIQHATESTGLRVN